MNRIKRIANELLESHPNNFTDNFEQNKKIMTEIAIVRSKSLRNRVAGYIASKLKRENSEEKESSQVSPETLEE